MKPIALVVLNYNGITLLQKFINDLIVNSPEADVVLIDNHSSDGSAHWFKSNYPDHQCIELDKNYGYAGGYNEGLRQVKHSLYGLLNSDIWVPSLWLPPLLEQFKLHEEVAILQPHILDYKKQSYFEYAGAAGGYIDQYGFPFCRGRILQRVEQDTGQYDQTRAVFWASGACFLIRSEVFWKLGGFDSDFFAHQEEIDLCWRAYNNGYKAQSVGSSKVYHIGGATLAPSVQKVYLNHRNSLYMLAKNLPKHKRLSILFTRLLLDGFIGLGYLFQLKFLHLWAIIRAHFAFYQSFKRMVNKSTRQPQRTDYFFTVSILLNYFLRRRLYFSDLDKKFK
ncbi:glycosyltransferase family 2 protein [Flavobacteriaceae bacterium]|jgi:GT2 family glycosyltransferase|nr:glycosyltransferase family 2 protein [Flavobacteriaceae bacterium]